MPDDIRSLMTPESLTRLRLRARRALEQRDEELRRARRAAIGCEEAVARAPGGEQLAIRLAHHAVRELHRSALQARDPGLDHDRIVVARGLAVAAARLDHRQRDAGLLDLAIGRAQRADQLGAADFEPAQVVRVVDEAHAVGVAVAHAQHPAVHHALPPAWRAALSASSPGCGAGAGPAPSARAAAGCASA